MLAAAHSAKVFYEPAVQWGLRQVPPIYHLGAVAPTPSTVTPGAIITMPQVGDFVPAESFRIQPHRVPGGAEVMDQLGLPPDTELPTSASEAVELGIQVGTSIVGYFAGPAITAALTAVLPGVVTAISSALTTIGAATGLGSLIPGIGNLVGLAIAGLVELGKAFARMGRGPQQCEFDPKCEDIGAMVANLSPVDAVPVLARAYAGTSMRLAKEARREDCVLLPVGGGNPEGPYGCLRFMEQAFDHMLGFAQKTVQDMGIPQLRRLLPLYEQMPKHGWYVDVRSSDDLKPLPLLGEKLSRVRDWTTKAAVAAEARGDARSEYDLSVSGMIRAMQLRLLFLTELERQARGLDQASPSQLARLRFLITTEVQKATTQYIQNQSVDLQRWLQQTGVWLRALLAREAAELARRQAEQAATVARSAVIEASPALRRSLAIDQLQFECGQQGPTGPACVRLREVRAGAPLRPHEGSTQPTKAPTMATIQAPKAPTSIPGSEQAKKEHYWAAVQAARLQRESAAKPGDQELKKRAFWAAMHAANMAKHAGVAPPAAAAPAAAPVLITRAPLPAAVVAPAAAPAPRVVAAAAPRPPVVAAAPPAPRGAPAAPKRYPSGARKLWDPSISMFRVYVPTGSLGFSPTFSVSFGAVDLAELADAADVAVQRHIASRADRRPPGRAVAQVQAFQAAERASREGAPGSLVVDGLWGNSSREAAAHYLGVPVQDTAPTAFRSASTWTAPPVRLPAAAPTPAPVAVAPAPTPAPVAVAVAPAPAPVAAPRVLIPAAPVRAAPAPSTRLDPRSPEYMRQQQVLAAMATYAAFQDPAVNWGTEAYPNMKLHLWQRLMGGLRADGIMGPLTRARVAALGAGTIGPRPRSAATRPTAPAAAPAPLVITREPAPALPPAAHVPPGDVLAVQPGKPVKVAEYLQAHPVAPGPEVVGMREVDQVASDPGIPPIGVKTSAAPSGGKGWGWLLAALLADMA
jgi:hypothetical protein